jgi:hypothetical protein
MVRCGRSGESRARSGPRPSEPENSADGRCRGRTRSLRSSHRQFVRRAARQFFRSRWFAGILQRRRHLGPWISRRAFPRRLRRLSGLDRRVLLRIDRHLLLPSFHADGSTARCRQCSTASNGARCVGCQCTQCIRWKAPQSRRAGNARPPRRHGDPAFEWRCAPTRARRSRRSL